MCTTNEPPTPRPEEKGSSHFLLLGLIQSVVEKHGGHMETNQKNNTFTVRVPEEQKAACFRELEEILALGKPISGFPSFVRS